MDWQTDVWRNESSQLNWGCSNAGDLKALSSKLSDEQPVIIHIFLVEKVNRSKLCLYLIYTIIRGNGINSKIKS